MCKTMRWAALLTALPLVLAATASQAAIYRWVDAQGVVHYSDTPHPGAQSVVLPPVQTYSAPPAPAASSPSPSHQTASKGSVSCAIAQPAAQQSLFAPQVVHVSVDVAPGVRPGDRVQVRFDGKALQPVDPGGMHFDVPQPYRGAHTLTASVIDAQGRTLCNAEPVTFYVRRPSIDSPQSPLRHRRAPPPPPPHSG